MSKPDSPAGVAEVAKRLAEQLDLREQEYALGGAIALGYWGVPRGTVDVDITIFLPPERPSECVWLLQEIGCQFPAAGAAQSLHEHGFCRVNLWGRRVDVFLPIVPFYEAARKRRRWVELDGQSIAVWDAESLAVFKMMFFRRKDLADLEQVLTAQDMEFDRTWVREQLVAMYGARDPRLAQWDDLTRDVPAE